MPIGVLSSYYNLFFSQIELKFIDLAIESLFFLNMRIRNRMADFVTETGIKSAIVCLDFWIKAVFLEAYINTQKDT